MSGADRRLRLLLFLLPLGLLGCATQRVDIRLLPPPAKPYSASLQMTVSLRSHGFTAQGGCAVDPARGARIELRGPSGAARLLLLVERDRARLVDVRRGLLFTWTAPSSEIPWAPADLWFLFTGRTPAGIRTLQATERGTTAISWDNGTGTVECHLKPQASSPLGFVTADCRTPGGTELKVDWKSFQEGSFPESAFQPPPGLDLAPASLEEVLRETSP